MSFLEFRPDPADDAQKRPRLDILNEFASESPAATATAPAEPPQPDAIDSIIRRLRLAPDGSPPVDAAGNVTRSARVAALVHAIVRPIRSHPRVSGGAAAVVGVAMIWFWVWPLVSRGATRLQAGLNSVVVNAIAPPAPVEPAPETPVVTAPRATAPTRGLAGRAANATRGAAIQSQASAAAAIEAPAAANGERRPVLVITDLPARTASSVEPQAADSAAAPAVYSRANTDVRPPKMRSPDTPRTIGGGLPTRTQTIEVLVNEQGNVEQVKLRTATPRMLDAMFLSRAKMWQFEPALRDGRPVPYWLVVPWQTSDR